MIAITITICITIVLIVAIICYKDYKLNNNSDSKQIASELEELRIQLESNTRSLTRLAAAFTSITYKNLTGSEIPN